MYYDFWLQGHPAHGIPTLPDIFRGPLSASTELFNRPGYMSSPQNLGPDDHSWVLLTHEDAWTTAVRGTSDLINDILECADLESLCIPDFDHNT